MSSTEYAGVLAIVATVFVVMFALDLDSKVGSTVRSALCQIFDGGKCGTETAADPEKCLTGQSTTSSNANVFIAFVQVDKDSILIREDFSDGSSKFTIVDNTEAAGELFAGAKAKVGKYGFEASAEAMAGVGLAGGKVFEFDNPEDANAFQDAVQAAGGFDGIVRDLASYDDEIPIIGVKNPLGGLNDSLLDALGVDDNGDLPEPNETYYEGKAFLNGSAGAGAGVGIADADIAALIEGAGVVKVTNSGDNKGDVEFTVQIEGEANGNITAATLGAGGQGKTSFTATISLDAQNGYKPDKLVLKGTGGITGGLDSNIELAGRRAQGHLERAGGALAGLQRRATARASRSRASWTSRTRRTSRPRCARWPARTLVPLARRSTTRASSASTPTTSRPPRPRARSRSASASAAAGAAAPAARPRATARAYVRPPGGTFAPRVCKQPS